MKALKLTLLLLLLMPGLALGATYTVCTSGCDYTTPQAVFDAVNLDPGDIVELRADVVSGTSSYVGAAVQPGADDVGAEGNHIIIRGRTGDTITIDGSGAAYAWIQPASRNYYTWQNLRFINGSTYTFRLQGGIGFHFQNVTIDGGVRGLYMTTNAHTDVDITGLVASNMTTDYGIRVQTDCIDCQWSNVTTNGNKASGVRIEYAGTLTGPWVIDNFTASLNQANGYQIQPSSGTRDYSALTLSNGTLNSNYGHSFYVNNADGGTVTDLVTYDSYNPSTTDYHHAFSFVTASNWTVSRVRAYNGDDSFVLQDGSNGNAFNNILAYGPKKATGRAFYSNSTNANNTLVNSTISSDLSGQPAADIDGGDSGWTIKNTIFEHTGNGTAFFLEAGGSYPTMDYNCFYGSATPISDKGTDRSLSAWKTASSQDANSINADPLLHTDYTLKAGSPAINAGTTLAAAYATDFDGNDQRRFGRGWEIGAYVFKEVSSFGVGF